MAKHIIHQGRFASLGGTLWRVELWRELTAPPTSVGEFEFDGNEPLIIEWGEAAKDATLCPSTATLRVISPGDGTYQQLYTIKAGSVGMHLYREEQLYWCGTLDAEFYEEPYEERDNYVVSLTFSDLGILERVPLPLRGMVSLEQLLTCVQQVAALDALTLDTSLMGLRQSGGLLLPINEVAVRADNWCDDKATYATLKQVLEDVLQPLALRLVSRGGRLYLHDLHGLHSAAQREKIVWMSDAQTLSMDKVVNDCTLTFSPNTQSTLFDGKLTFTSPTSLKPSEVTTEVHTYEQPMAKARNAPRLTDFLLYLSPQGKGLAYIHPSARYFRRMALGGGSQDEGVAWTIAQGLSQDTYHGESVFLPSDSKPPYLLNNPRDTAGGSTHVVMRTQRVYLPPCSSPDYMLRLKLPLLADVRYNPFHDPSPINETERKTFETFKVLTGWAFVPFRMAIYDEEGRALCHYTNKGMATSAGHASAEGLGGTWEEGAGWVDDAWLAYYDRSKPQEDTALSGWAVNRHCIGRPDVERRTTMPLHKNEEHHVYDAIERMGEGQLIPYPPVGGYLEIEVYAGLRCYDYGEDAPWEFQLQWTKERLHEKLRWVLYKAPQLEICRRYGNFAAADIEDVTLRAVVNPDAREHLSLDLSCGTHPEGAPSARGLLYRHAKGRRRTLHGMLTPLVRAGDQGTPERLLLNTLFSQFATRHLKLSGVCALSSAPLPLYTEGCQEGRVFLMTSCTTHLGEDTQEATFVELSPETFRPSNA